MALLRVLYHFAGRKADTGSPRSLINHIDILDRQRVEPWFLATGEGPLTEALRARRVHVEIGQPKAVSPRFPLDSVRRVRAQMARLRQWRVDIVHINELGWNLDLVLGAWLLRVPVVLHIHLFEIIHFQNLHRFLASAVIMVSEEQRKTMRHFERIRHKARVIYNPVPIDDVGSGRSLRESLGMASDDWVVGTIAQIREGKGIDLLLETARIIIPKYPKALFLIIGRAGEGQEDYAERMIEGAKDPAFRGRVRFIGSRRDIPDLLATMDTFFLPTRVETLSVAVVEAMAARLPVVTTRVGGMTELLPSREVGTIVEPATPEGFAVALARYIDDPIASRRVGERAAESLRGRFDPPSVRRNLEQLYFELAPR
jgi:glycosyltransferase involved in cell wall biosynthesis